MDLFIAALSSAGLVTVVAWLCRNLIFTRLSNAVKYEYDEKLEKIKTELKARQTEIETLRTFALSGATVRHTELCQLQVAAVEQLWGAVIALTPVKKAVNFMGIIDFKKAVKQTTERRTVFTKVLAQFDQKLLENDEPARCRPFVSSLAWALYSAYTSVLRHETSRLKVLEEGRCSGYIDADIEEVIKAALPHRAGFGPKTCFREILEELESSLLEELKNILEGENADQQNIARAALILSKAERLSEGISQSSIMV